MEDSIVLNGTICAVTGAKTTPLGRIITRFVMALYEPLNGTFYMPCIVYGAPSIIELGQALCITGNLQNNKEFFIRQSEIIENKEESA